jgi:ribosomal-protein-alanine N-acetyltransferase
MDHHTVRPAAPADAVAIDDLLSAAEHLVGYIDQDDAQQFLEREDLYLLEIAGELVCVCGLVTGPEAIARISLFALKDGWPAPLVCRLLLPAVRCHLFDRGLVSLAFIGLEQWLLEGLMANGFRCTNTIITLQKATFEVPDQGNASTIVRPAEPRDFAAILAIDEAAFAPFWRNTRETLAQYLSESPFFRVARLENRIVGYACVSLAGRHGHLTRVAVHPRYQGQRIGIRLLAEAIRFLQQKRVFGITLNTQRDNHSARRLYEWFGFKVLGKEAQVLVLDI